MAEHTHLQGPPTYAAALTAANNRAATKTVLHASRLGSHRGAKTAQQPGLFAMSGDKDGGNGYAGSGDKACYFCRDPSHIRSACELYKQAKEMAKLTAEAAITAGKGGSGQKKKGKGKKSNPNPSAPRRSGRRQPMVGAMEEEDEEENEGAGN